jgi:iron complex transport system substrate-binding protein
MNLSPDLEELARLTIDCGFKLHKALGPGLLESVYEAVMMDRLTAVGLAAERQKVIEIEYQGMISGKAFAPISWWTIV